MGIAELQTAWTENRERIADDYREWDEQREAAIPDHAQALAEFLSGALDVEGFRSRMDSLTKKYPLWGFRGTSQMFFNQLTKAADPAALDAALKTALPAPADEDEAVARLEGLVAAVEAARERADTVGATRPGVGRVDAFVTFFWELQDREAWPIFFPNSRNVLEEQGLLDVAQPQPALYRAYRARVMELKELLDTGSWGVEHLLWFLGQGQEQDGPEGGDDGGDAENGGDEQPAGPTGDLYVAYRGQGLYFPDEVVTSLVLSLATKRFVVLSGISGTGKTQIALGLGRHLEQLAGAPPEQPEPAAPPEQDPANLYVRLTPSNLKRKFVSLAAEAREIIDEAIGLPERGTSRYYETRLPDGSQYRMRLNNIGFENSARETYRLYLRQDIARWVEQEGEAGDLLHLVLSPAEGVDFDLNLIPGAAAPVAAEETARHVTIAVRSDWTDPRGLIGYFNPLTTTYVRTALIDILLRASADPDRPYLVLLDEMNLARVEYYFSDFLSALESGDPVTLMSPEAAEENAEGRESAGEDVELPDVLAIPSNVSFVGTVNVDETTHPFSPKVLDRANVIEFSEVDVERALGHGDEAPDAGLRLTGGALDPAWLCTDKEGALALRSRAHESETFTEALEDVHAILARFDLQFGYRVIDEISGFVGHALDKTAGDPETVTRIAFDLQLRQKVVPKLSGGRELEEPLVHLLQYCLDGKRATGLEAETVRAAARQSLDPKTEGGPLYAGAARKLTRMLDRLAGTGFVGALD